MKNCSRCGAAIQETDRVCPTCGKILEPSAALNGDRRWETARQPFPQNAYVRIPEPRVELRWFRFLTRLGLWADAAATIIFSLVMLTDLGREGLESYYLAAPELGTIEFVFGILLLPVAAFGIITAVRLIRFCASAPKHLRVMQVVRAFLAFAQLAAVLIIINNHDELALRFGMIRDTLLTTVLAGIAVPINWIYFKRRESLFTN